MKTIIATTFALALAFTLSCSGDDGGEDPSSSSVIETPSSSSVGVSSSSDIDTNPSSSSAGETPSSSSEGISSSSSEEIQVNPVKTCIEDAIENENNGGNIRAVWRNCSGNSTATGAEALEGFWVIMADENGKYFDCDQTSNVDAATIISSLKSICNVR